MAAGLGCSRYCQILARLRNTPLASGPVTIPGGSKKRIIEGVRRAPGTAATPRSLKVFDLDLG